MSFPTVPTAPAVQTQDTLTLSQVRDTLVSAAARRWGVDPALAVAVSHVENWTGQPRAISSRGAVGLMQVMPFHLGRFPGCAPVSPLAAVLNVQTVLRQEDLYDPVINVCYGVRLLRHYLRVCHGRLGCALVLYSGGASNYVALVHQRINQGS